MNYIASHPWLLALLIPTILASVQSLVGMVEKRAIAALLSKGDAADQELIRSVIRASVLWAEKKHLLPGMGPVKFEKVDALAARAFPFLSADQRAQFIEAVFKEIDDGAHKALDDSPPPQA